jgi:AraC-like DNA-binding protein
VKHILLPPPPHLSGYVKCFWAFEYTPADDSRIQVRTFASEACGIQVLLNQQGEYLRGSIQGITTHPQIFEPTRSIVVFGAQLHAAVLSPLFRLSGWETVNQSIPLEMFHHETLTRLKGSDDMITRFQHLAAFITSRLHDYEPTRCADYLKHIRRNAGNITVSQLKESFGVSERTLERHFATELGISPQFFIKMLRFREAFDQLKSPQKTFTDIAYEMGYFDQAHFINDVKRFSGLTPASLREKIQRVDVNQRGDTQYLIDEIG